MSLILNKKRKRFSRTRRFLQRFIRSTEATPTKGNGVDLYPTGEEFFEALFESLRRAERSICLEFYIVRDDSIGVLLADILIAAVARGVAVSLLYDYIGSFDTPAIYFRKLEQKGVHCKAFNPPQFNWGWAWFDKRDHRKIVVVDGSVAFVGSLNIGTEYSGGHGEDSDRWRDVGIRVCGPAVTELQRLICESWERETGVIPEGCLNGSANPPETGDAVIHIVGSRPHKDRSSIRNAFRYTIAGASHEIMIANPYFVPGPRVIRSLLRAAKRGVRVRLILPEVNDVPLVQLVSRSTYAQLLKGGVEIYERQGTVLHAKVMLIDGYWSVMGSANLDQRSFHRNYEVNLIIDSVTFGDQVEKMLENDLLFSRPVVLEEHEQRGFLIRFMERVVAPVSWFL